jgi:hypothetical protein
MTADHPVRRLLARVCSADTMARVVDPTLADMRWEHWRPRWRGYVSLTFALSMHALTSVPSAIGRACVEDDHAISKVLLISTCLAFLFAVPLIGLPFLAILRQTRRLWVVVTLLPQALALTLPAALLVAVPASIHRHALTARLIRRVLLVSLLNATMTLALIGYVMPVSNQAFRAASSGISNPPRGPNELSLTEMRNDIVRLREFRGGQPVVREREFQYEMRFALSAAAVPLALLAIAFTLTRPGRRHPLVTGMVSVGIYIGVLFGFEHSVARPLLLGTATAPGTIAWIPNATLVLMAGIVAAGGTRREHVGPCA